MSLLWQARALGSAEDSRLTARRVTSLGTLSLATGPRERLVGEAYGRRRKVAREEEIPPLQPWARGAGRLFPFFYIFSRISFYLII